MSDNMPEGERDELARLRAQREDFWAEKSEKIRAADKVEVYCGDSSHEPRRFGWMLYRDQDGVWRPLSLVHKGLRFERLNADLDSPFGYTGPDRFTYEFKCHWCKTTVPARGEKLTPILDTLADSGVPSMPLADIRTYL
jgi:hypothetical protein